MDGGGTRRGPEIPIRFSLIPEPHLMIDSAAAPANVPAEDSELPTADTPSPITVPDRADAPVSEVTERFLRAVIAKVPLAHIEELHLFSPLRQSGVETGIAVVAARVPLAEPVVEALADLALELDGDAIAADESATGTSVEQSSVEDAELVDAGDAVESDLAETAGIEPSAEVDTTFVEGSDATADLPQAALEDMDSEATAAATADEEADADDVSLHQDATEDSPYLEDGVAAHAESVSVLASDAADDEPLDDESPNDAAIPDAIITPIERHTVYTARYRLVQKGPERGKWEADVVAEADAPLITVEMVVRGVQRRAGEESEILRYSAAQIARALRMEWPPAAPSVTSPDAAAA